MKKTLFFLLTTLLMTLGASAQKGSFYLHLSQSGTITSYNLADISKVHFGGNTMDIVTAGGTDSYAYSPLNTATVSTDPDPQLDYTNGFGTDGSYEAPSQDDSGYYLIDNGGKLFWLAQQVNNGAGTAFNAKLTADIDLENRLWTPMGTASYKHGGEFDGQGHSITGLNVNTNTKYTAFIGYHSGTTSVHDFTIAGSVTYTGNTADHCVAGVIAFNAGVNIVEDIICSVNIETPNATADVRIAGIVAREENAGTINRCTYSGTNNGYGTAMQVAGIVGIAGNSGNNMKVTNCLFTGTLKATNTGAYVGGIAGYIGKSGTSFKNCLSAGSYEVPSGATRTGALIGAGNGNVTATTFDNCYILTGQSEKGSTSGISATISYTAVNDAQLANGTVTAALGDNWAQGAATPYPSDPNAQPAGHTHSFVNGFCTDATCTAPYEEATQDADGYYLIDNGGKLFWFAQQVNDGTGTTYNLKLTADIDLENRPWTPMGNSTWTSTTNGKGTVSTPYKHTGEFDGQGHSINNLYISADEATAYAAFIGTHSGTKDVKNFKIYGSATTVGTSENHFVAGVIGNSDGNHTVQDIWSYVNLTAPSTGTISTRLSGVVARAASSTINRCVYAGTANGYGTNLQVAGIVGWNSAANTTITNCLFSGSLSSTGTSGNSAYHGGILGYAGNYGNLNCSNNLCIGTVTSATGATRTGALVGNNVRSSSFFTNNYVLEGLPITGTSSTVIPTITEVTTAQLTDGTLPAKLSASNWVQGATYPIPQDNSTITEDDLTVDGIKYIITSDNTVAVTYPNENQPASGNASTYTGEITIPATVTIKGATFNVTAIGDYAFWGANITSLTLPEGIVSLGYKTIYNTQITEITVPNSVTSMDYEALGYNKQLVTINFGENIAANTWGDKLCIYGGKKYEVYMNCNAVPTLRNYTFDFSGANVHVRPTMYSAFKADAVWSQYDIIGDLWIDYTYADLQTMIANTPVPSGAAVGTDPGCYTPASVQALSDAIAAASALDETATLEQLNTAINGIIIASDNLQTNELQEGYYAIENMYKPYALYANAATADTEGLKLETPYDASKEKFFFKLTRQGGNWLIQSVETGMYVGTIIGATSATSSDKYISLTAGPDNEQIITWVAGGAFKIQGLFNGSATLPYAYYNYGAKTRNCTDSETRIHWHFHPAEPGKYPLDFNLENGRVRGFVHDFEYTASDGSKVSTYKKNPPARLDQPVPATVFWTRNASSTAQQVTWSTSSTFADATTVSVDNSNASYEIYNLIPGKTYYYKVTATVGGAETELINSSFTTSGQVRMIKADGISNIRDLGGWPTESGYTVSYGKIFRGAAFTSTTITPEGIEAVRDAGVRAELDLRDGSQDGSMSASLLGSDVEYNRIMLAQTASHMNGLTGSKSQYIACVQYVLDCVKNDKPVYFHCAIGRDRTGTLAFLLEGVLGMSKSDIYKDYELTNFSNLNTPCSKTQLDDMFTMIEGLSGATLEEKFRTYLTTEFGISSDDIDAFRAKMLNLPQEITIGATGYSTYVSEQDLIIPEGVTAYGITGLDGTEVELTQLSGSVLAANEPVILAGEAGVKYNFFTADGAGNSIAGNLLVGTGTEGKTVGENEAYILYNNQGTAVFRIAGAMTLPAYKAYLPAAVVGGAGAKENLKPRISNLLRSAGP